jgi:oligopeptide/dipeptide ABC transporter ATP-binding protein
MDTDVLKIERLHVDFPIHIGTVRAVNDVSLTIKRGKTMGLVGESGCGKSTLGFSILRLLRPPGRIASGKILFQDNDIVSMTEAEVKSVRGNRISMIFQDPLTSLNPLFTIGEQFVETIRVHEPQLSKKEATARAGEMLSGLGISPDRLKEYPHQMSGGMRQRIMIGIGLVLNPELLIADEPTTALDVIVEAHFLDLLKELSEKLQLSIMLITHNLGVVAQMADRVTVMYGGRIMETGEAEAIFAEPKHPYTRGLLDSVPNINLTQPQLNPMEGIPPDLVNPPTGCVFHPRCPKVMDICRQKIPVESFDNEHMTACWLWGE